MRSKMMKLGVAGVLLSFVFVMPLFAAVSENVGSAVSLANDAIAAADAAKAGQAADQLVTLAENVTSPDDYNAILRALVALRSSFPNDQALAGKIEQAGDKLAAAVASGAVAGVTPPPAAVLSNAGIKTLTSAGMQPGSMSAFVSAEQGPKMGPAGGVVNVGGGSYSGGGGGGSSIPPVVSPK